MEEIYYDENYLGENRFGLDDSLSEFELEEVAVGVNAERNEVTICYSKYIETLNWHCDINCILCLAPAFRTISCVLVCDFTECCN